MAGYRGYRRCRSAISTLYSAVSLIDLLSPPVELDNSWLLLTGARKTLVFNQHHESVFDSQMSDASQLTLTDTTSYEK